MSPRMNLSGPGFVSVFPFAVVRGAGLVGFCIGCAQAGRVIVLIATAKGSAKRRRCQVAWVSMILELSE